MPESENLAHSAMHPTPSSSYQVLARRSRPQSFAELVGQEPVAASLGTILESGRIPHAFLFTGTRGTGKTSSARILAKSLCCVNGPTIAPCQVCPHCVAITACAHEDVLEIDGASNTGVDNVRELREAARFHPTSARFKVFIIDEVHMLSIGAFNALLKTLEEPPPQVVFVLATTELHKVPVTVRSRCMLFTFKKYAVERIAEHLRGILDRERVPYDNDAVMLVAREAKGSMRDSLNLLEQALAFSGGSRLDAQKTHAVLSVLGEDIAQNLFAAVCERRPDAALEALREADDASLDLATLLDTTATLARHALVLKEVNDPAKATRLTALLPSEMDHLRFVTTNINSTALGEFYRLLSQASRDAARSTMPLQWAEVAIIDCLSRADWLSAGDLLACLVGEGGGGPNTGPGPGNSGGKSHSTPPEGANASARPSAPAPAPSPWAKASVAQAQVAQVSPQTGQVNVGSLTQAKTEGRVDFAAVAALVSRVEKRGPGLASKLRHAVFEDFRAARVAFAPTPQNSLYTDFSESDAALFVEELRALGFGNAELAGLQLPRGVVWRATPARPGAAQAEPDAMSAHAVPAPRPRAGFLTRPDFPAVSAPAAPNASRSLSPATTTDPIATDSAVQPTPPPRLSAPVPQTRPAPIAEGHAPILAPLVKAGAATRVSYATHERHLREMDFDERSRALLARPELAALARVATQVAVSPLRRDGGE